jgi:flagellar operon protein
MDVTRLDFRSTAVVTGTPALPQHQSLQDSADSTQSFDEVLHQELAKVSDGVSFSKHAALRAEQRSIDLSETSIARLNQGVRLAEQKGLNDTLILVDRTAFLVNVPNNTVITAVHGNDLNGNVFTNIDGTVVI